MTSRKPSLTSLIAFAMIATPLVYVVSYAPVVRALRLEGSGIYVSPSDELIPMPSEYAAYQPVDWLIDSTPLREAMLWWAGLWGVREEFELASTVREFSPMFYIEVMDAYIDPRHPSHPDK